MKSKHLLIVAAAALALLVLRSFLAGPEERVRQLLHGMAAEASKEGDEAPIVAAAKARALADSFTEQAVAERVAKGESVQGRQEIAQAIGWARSNWIEGDVELEGLELRLLGPEEAAATFVLRILDREGYPAAEFDGMEVELKLRKEAGDWLIARALVREPVRE